MTPTAALPAEETTRELEELSDRLLADSDPHLRMSGFAAYGQSRRPGQGRVVEGHLGDLSTPHPEEWERADKFLGGVLGQ